MDQDLRPCRECEKEYPRRDLNWVKDRYGIPFKLVCDGCYEKVEDAILEWEFDAANCDERLEPDY